MKKIKNNTCPKLHSETSIKELDRILSFRSVYIKLNEYFFKFCPKKKHFLFSKMFKYKFLKIEENDLVTLIHAYNNIANYEVLRKDYKNALINLIREKKIRENM